MSDIDLLQLSDNPNIARWRVGLATWVESPMVQYSIITVILINAVILGMEATPFGHGPLKPWLIIADHCCLGIFVVELLLKALAYRWGMLRSGWNVFDTLVVIIALVPASGPASVLRGLRVLRVFRLLTAVPSMRRVVAAFLHAIPGLGSVMALMSVFFYVAAVMATGFFGDTHPEWFGHLGKSLYTLFQIMTLESWSMGIVRPVMEQHPYAWVFFLPFIIMATFTILNLFIGIIVSTMQELAANEAAAAGAATKARKAIAYEKARVAAGENPTLRSEPSLTPSHAASIITRLERDLAELRQLVSQQSVPADEFSGAATNLPMTSTN
jgi:voltage-gated sodium channel